MIELNDAQTWTVIGVLAATMLSAVAAMSHFAARANHEAFGRVLDRIDLLGASLGQRIDELDARLTQRIDELDARLTQRIDALDARLTQRIDALDARITIVDRDVQALANRAFGRGPAAE